MGTGAGSVRNEKGVSANMQTFLQEFFTQFPRFQKLDFFIFGESYAGHYIPAIAHTIWQSNKDGSGVQVPLKGVAIGNGLTNQSLMLQLIRNGSSMAKLLPNIAIQITSISCKCMKLATWYLWINQLCPWRW